MRVAIFVDALVNMGGVERLVLEQAKLFNADIYVGRYSEKNTFSEFKEFKIICLSDGPETGFKTLKDKLFTISLWGKFSKIRLNYDMYIIHGSAALNAAKHHHPNIWYCHSPSRYLYDLYEEEKFRQRGIRKILFPYVTTYLRRRDQQNVKSVDKILVNSVNVQNRVKKYYKRDSVVVYPFVDTKKFRYIETGDFYLSACRLDRIKRVELSIKAFLMMPDKKLVVASDGPEKDHLIKIAKGAKNISFLGYVSNEKLKDLYGRCLASIYLSHKEDFGMIPIESMAAGKPCIATNEGGFRETIIHKKTGYLVDHPENIEEVIAAVNYMGKKRSESMRYACEKKAALFALDVFREKMKKEISKI